MFLADQAVFMCVCVCVCVCRGGGGGRGGEKIRREGMHESSSCHASSHTRRDVSLTFQSPVPVYVAFGAILDYVVEKRKKMPSIPWKPFGLNNILPRRFPRQRRGNKRQPIVPLKEWKIVRGDTVRKKVIIA